MGAWKDLLDALKASVSGPITFGGTIFPTSEGFPSMPAQVVKGGFYALETLEQLADIPYENLQLNMEVVVGEHIRPDLSTHERTKYFLVQLPGPGTKVSEVPAYDLTSYWQESQGDDGIPGDNGDHGWSAVFGTESDGPNREVEKFLGWMGGTGVQPATPVLLYKGTTGFVSKASATNIKGGQGIPGSAVLVRPEYYVKNIPGFGGKSIGAPLFTWSVAQNTSGYASISLQITNSWTSSRKFKVFGEVGIANDEGALNVVVKLKIRLDSNWPVSPDSGGSILDENFSRIDWVNSPSPGSIHKIKVDGLAQLAAGETQYVRLVMKKVGGGTMKYNFGFIEAFGL